MQGKEVPSVCSAVLGVSKEKDVRSPTREEFEEETWQSILALSLHDAYAECAALHRRPLFPQ
jgi:hypothetical protein